MLKFVDTLHRLSIVFSHLFMIILLLVFITSVSIAMYKIYFHLYFHLF